MKRQARNHTRYCSESCPLFRDQRRVLDGYAGNLRPGDGARPDRRRDQDAGSSQSRMTRNENLGRRGGHAMIAIALLLLNPGSSRAGSTAPARSSGIRSIPMTILCSRREDVKSERAVAMPSVCRLSFCFAQAQSIRLASSSVSTRPLGVSASTKRGSSWLRPESMSPRCRPV
jgi:hypothetical protein